MLEVWQTAAGEKEEEDVAFGLKGRRVSKTATDTKRNKFLLNCSAL